MLSLPRSRNWLLPTVLLLVFVLFYRSIIHVPTAVKTVVRFRPPLQIQYGVRIPQEFIEEHFIPHRDPSQGHLWPEQKYYYIHSSPTPDRVTSYLKPLLQCHQKPNPHTNHIRLPNIIQNVSQLVSPSESPTEQKFNPTIIALPPWSPHQYLLVSRVVTEGLHQESLLCEASTCYSGLGPSPRRPGEKDCTADDIAILGAAGGLRCATPPKIISIPPTPAEKCEGSWSSFPDIPGFHDPRIFWSGKGEPLIMVNSASRYACVGLWIADLRTLHEPLKEILTSQPGQPYHPGPLMSYPSLTELTRNPASTRASVEKNWFMFFPTPEEAYLHYDLSVPRLVEDGNRNIGGRTFAKLIGNGFTTPNLTDPAELPCLPDEPDGRGDWGHWHQTSNALKLVLCRRAEAERGECTEEQEGRAVHFAVMHRKFSNDWDLPLRYERFFVVWDVKPPFRMLGMSRYPILMWNETASGWTAEQNWADGDEDTSQGDQSPSKGEDDGAEVRTHLPSFPNELNESLDHTTPPARNLTKKTWKNMTTTPELHPQYPQSPNPPRNWAYFTYTPSLSWSFRLSPSTPLREHENPKSHQRRTTPSSPAADTDTDTDTDTSEEEHTHARTLSALNTGFLDDEVVMGIGVDDRGQGVVRVRAEMLVGCLRMCPR